MASSSIYTKNANDYHLITVIGKACHGAASVSLAKHNPSSSYVAVKIIHLDQLEECDMELSLVQHEVLMARQHSHMHIVPIFLSFVHASQLWSVLPLMGFGSCKDLIHAHFNEGLPEMAIAHIMRDILQALNYLHQRGIIHRSVKASHITISGEGTVCLSGLRYSMCMLQRGNRNSNVFDFPDHYITSLLWAAPEILQQNLSGYNTSSDIYSLGITACELANGVVPFSDMPTTQMLLEKIEGTKPRLLDSSTLLDLHTEESDSADHTLPYKRTFSENFHDFVAKCLQGDPKSRPSASQLMQHSFIKQLRRSQVEPLACLLRPVQPLLNIIKGIPPDEGQDVSDIEYSIAAVEISNSEQWIF